MEIKRSYLWSWVGQRISAIIVAVALPIHIIAIPFSDKKISFSFVSERLSHAEWLTLDILLLLACIYHGLNGIYSISIDFNPNKRIVRGLLLFLWGFGIILSIYGVSVLWRFIR